MRSPLVAFALTCLVAPGAIAQTASPVRMPPEIGAAYGRLGKAIVSQDAESVKTVWAEDFIVNSPSNTVLRRDQVIAAMRQDLLDYKDFRKNITVVDEKPGAVVVMGYDTMIPLKGPGAGKQVVRPFTDVWMKRGEAWMLVARQATIAAAN
ncbi:nuclear transport factor 2 family protein [Caulobacter radicis]|nr:nuclear transport factor 2 family protein [Caulobacter radicis]